MSVVHGPQYGPLRGPRYGAETIWSPSGPPPVAPFDGPNSWYVPATAGDWTALGITAPGSYWGFQEAAGSIVDLGAGGLDLAAVGTVGYQAAVAGWSRFAATVAAGGNGFGRVVTEAPNAATTSVLWLGYLDLTGGSGTSRCIITGSDSAGATELSARHSAANLQQIKCLTNSNNGVVDLQAGGAHAIALLYDRTNARTAVYSEFEKVTGVYGAGVVDGNKGFRGGVVAAPAMSILWGAVWTGANAELTDAQVKTLLQALNITIPWT